MTHRTLEHFTARLLLWPLLVAALVAQPQPAGLTPPVATPAAAPALKPMGTVLFIGNSFLFGSGSPLRYYRADTVTDLNGTGFGGVPAVFKSFAAQATLPSSMNCLAWWR